MYKELKFGPHPFMDGGVIAKHIFDNGYGVSVIKGPLSYGGPHLYELAVLRDTGLDTVLDYDQTVQHHDGTGLVRIDDVLGWLSPDLVGHYMTEISKLKRPTN